MGDRAAANTLVERYYDEIYRYAYRQSIAAADPKERAADLTQEIFISALRSLPTFNRGKASFRTWLYRVASSRIIDFHRKFRPCETQIDETALPARTDLTDDLQNRDLLQRVEKHIGALPSDMQRVLRLHLYGEMTFSQISSTMEMKESSVKTKFYRALSRIKEMFHDEYDG